MLTVPLAARLKLALVLVLGIVLLVPVWMYADTAQYFYDGLGRLSVVIDGQGNIATYNYDAVGNLLSITRGPVAAPAIVSISPNTIDAGAPVGVTITGSGFALASLASATPDLVFSNLVISDTAITVTVTVSNPTTFGPVSVNVVTPGGTASTTLTVTQPAPTIVQVSPISGRVGSTVTIIGTGFGTKPGSNRVTFPGAGDVRLVAQVITENNTRIPVRVPTGTTFGLVTVEVGGLISNGANFSLPGIQAINSTATLGTPAIPTQASVNIQGFSQVVQVQGGGFTSTSKVTYPTINEAGVLSPVSITIAPNADGTTATVFLLSSATTGLWSLDGGDLAPVLLQVVPTLTSFSLPPGATFIPGTTLTLSGTGFKEGATTVSFPGVPTPVPALDVSTDSIRNNSRLTVQIPPGVTAGSLTVQTDGGTSNALLLPELQTITATTASGVPTNPAVASANVGQVIQLQGTNVSSSTLVIFPRTTAAGLASTVVTSFSNINQTGTVGSVLVPLGATTGSVTITGVGAVPLQIVPTVTGVRPPVGQAIAPGVVVTVDGRGFKEGATQVTFPGAAPVFASDVSDSSPDNFNNSLTVTTPAGVAPGLLTVTTDGGTSNSFLIMGLQASTALAAQGAAANPADPSANTGQLIQLQGSGFSTTTPIVFPSTSDAGVAGTLTVFPVSVSSDGITASVGVPTIATTGPVTTNGVGSIQLQIVPTIFFISVPAGQTYQPGVTITIFGSGFKEGATVVAFPGAPPVMASDIAGFNSNLTVTVPSGATTGPLTVSTDGGISNVFQLRNPVLTAITAIAAQGTAANPAQASANVNQQITLAGSDLGTSTLVQFPSFDSIGAPMLVTTFGFPSPDGASLTVPVPQGAITGPVTVLDFVTRLGAGSVPLQLVPTVSHVAGSVTPGSQVTLSGGGFEPTTTQVQFPGASSLALADSASILAGGGQQATITVPGDAASTGLLTVQTTGGISNAFDLIAAGTTEVEPNDTPATATLLVIDPNTGEALKSATIDPVGDVDYYKFNVDFSTFGPAYRVEVLPGLTPGPPLNIRLTWLDQDGVTVLSTTEGPVDTGGGTVSFQIEPSIEGIYFFKVEELNSQGGPDHTYQIRLLVVAQ
jgi:YD repeat-containing protein